MPPSTEPTTFTGQVPSMFKLTITVYRIIQEYIASLELQICVFHLGSSDELHHRLIKYSQNTWPL